MTDQKPTARRARGDGSIYQTADGRHRAAVTLPDGRRKYLSGKTKRDVAARKRKLEQELASTGISASSSTLSEYLPVWLERQRSVVAWATWIHHRKAISVRLVPMLGNHELRALTPAHVEAMVGEIVASGTSPLTARDARRTLSKALGDAVRDGLLARNVAQLARPPRLPMRPIEYYTSDELGQLLEAAKGHEIGGLVTLAALTGMRQGELFGLPWASVDLEAGILRVAQALVRVEGGVAVGPTKTARSRRTLLLTPRAIASLNAEDQRQQALMAEAGRYWQNGDGLVFTQSHGQPWTSPRLNGAWKALVADAGVRYLPFRALRHSCATMLLDAGVGLAVVSEQLGHADVRMTAMRYAAVTAKLRRDAVDALERTLG